MVHDQFLWERNGRTVRRLLLLQMDKLALIRSRDLDLEILKSADARRVDAGCIELVPVEWAICVGMSNQGLELLQE